MHPSPATEIINSLCESNRPFTMMKAEKSNKLDLQTKKIISLDVKIDVPIFYDQLYYPGQSKTLIH